MKIFVLGLPHTQTRTEFSTCAFTMKTWNLCRMMHMRGHEVIHLGTEGSNPVCSENVAVTPFAMWQELYGHPGGEFYNLETEGKYKPYQELYARNVRQAIQERSGAPFSSIVCVTWGGAQRAAVEGLDQHVVESGIGYRHTGSRHRVFESYAWMHMIYGQEGRFEGGAWYDAVIPNAFDPDMFELRVEKEDHFLFLGRLQPDKGVELAVDLARRLGKRIKVVGQGDPSFIANGNPHVIYVPPVGVDERRRLLAEARALICPTYYVEPFGGVNVEAQMSGTPVITTDWGAFPETVCHGYTGYRCRTMEQFEWAARHIDAISPYACREWATQNYSIGRVALMYEEYFQSIVNLTRRGWYQSNDRRTQLDWLRKVHPPSRPLDLDQKLEAPEPDTWRDVNDWESDWWGLEPSPRWDEEIEKQKTYARLMGLPDDLDLTGGAAAGARVRTLDVGCGPVSMLLRARWGEPTGDPATSPVGVDPLRISDETRRRYRDKGIVFLNSKAEDIDPEAPIFRGGFDEVWIYNCLQHVDDPKAILARASRLARRSIRIFEWINLPPCPGHPHTLTEELFSSHLPLPWERRIWNVGALRGFGGTVSSEYIAIWLRNRETH